MSWYSMKYFLIQNFYPEEFEKVSHLCPWLVCGTQEYDPRVYLHTRWILSLSSRCIVHCAGIINTIYLLTVKSTMMYVMYDIIIWYLKMFKVQFAGLKQLAVKTSGLEVGPLSITVLFGKPEKKLILVWVLLLNKASYIYYNAILQILCHL